MFLYENLKFAIIKLVTNRGLIALYYIFKI